MILESVPVDGVVGGERRLAALKKWWGTMLGDWAVAVSIIELASASP
jgi:hypothetical protein